MRAAPTSRRRQAPVWTWPRVIVVGVGMIAAIQLTLVATGIVPLLDGRLIDGDCYMRLIRVLELHQHGDWYRSVVGRSNAPYGEMMHWTRPLDALLYAGAVLAQPVTGPFRDALYAWGVVVSPVLLCAGMAGLAWGTRAFLSRSQILLAVGGILFLPMILLVFSIGRPDHHSLHGALFLGQLAVLYRHVGGGAAAGPGPSGAGLWPMGLAGAMGGLALWVSLEGFVALAAIGAALGMLWIVEGRGAGRTVVVYLAGFAAMTVAGVAIEYPPDQWLADRYSRLSVAHGALAGGALASWSGIAVVAARRPALVATTVRRLLLAGLAGGVLPAGLALSAFPRLALGVWTDFDPDIIGPWLAEVAEFVPLVADGQAGQFAVNVLPILFAVPVLVGLLRRGSAAERRLAIASLTLVAVTLPAGLAQVRLVLYPQLSTLVPLVLTVAAVWRWRRCPFGRMCRVLRVYAVLGLAATPVLVGAALPRPASGAGSGACLWAHLGRHLAATADVAGLSPETTILTSVYGGPALLWETTLKVIGTPYGNTETFRDVIGFFSATDPGVAQAIAARRGVDLVAVCVLGTETLPFGPRNRGLAWALKTGMEVPPWLVPFPVPAPLSETFRVYRVADSGPQTPGRGN